MIAILRRFIAGVRAGSGMFRDGPTFRFRRVVFCTLLIGFAAPDPEAAETEGDSRAVTTEFGYIGDFLHNASGGIRAGSAYLKNIDATVRLDLGRIFGTRGGSMFVYLLWNNASTFSDRYSGDTQVVSNIDAERALRLFQLWYEHRISDGLSLKTGLYDLNSEFDAVDSASLFLNSSHGIIPTYSQTGVRGPSIFPVTSLSARLEWEIDNDNIIRYALLDAVPGDPANPSATAIKLSSREGVLHAIEYTREFSGALRLGLGAFSYSAEFESLYETDAWGNPVRRGGNAGWYGFAEGMPYADAANRRTASVFLRYGTANGALNPFESYVGAGMVLSGFVPRRPDDQIGVSLALARCGEDFRAANNARSHETAIELTYLVQIHDRLRIQPDIQYIINPGADRTIENALVLGIRLELNHGFHHR